MAKSQDLSIRFACPRCLLPLQTRAALAGAKRRCPRCQWLIQVPKKSTLLGPQEGYALHEGDGSAAYTGQPYVAMFCPLCYTHIAAPADQLGQEVACPDCGTKVVVALPAKPEKPAAKPLQPGEGYQLHEETTWSPQPSPPAAEHYFPVRCPVCDTFMQASGAQVGQQMVCPDCRRPFTVPPVPKKRAASTVAPLADEDIYAVSETARQWSAETPSSGQSSFAVHCPVCDTRLQATDGQVGRDMECPDCSSRFVVPPRPKTKLKTKAVAAEEYRARAAPEVFIPKPLFDDPRWQREPALPVVPPRWAFFSGVFTFPFYRSTLPRWLLVSLVGCVPMLFAAMVLSTLVRGQEGIGNVPSVLELVLAAGSMYMIGGTAIMILMWIVVVSAQFVAILVDTAYGCDEVENWPSGLMHDWMTNGVFIWGSLIVSAVAVIALAKLMAMTAVVVDYVLPATFLGLFPFLLLCMVETNSPIDPISLPVWRSLITRWWAWILFYAESTALVLATGWLLGRLVSWAFRTMPLALLLTSPLAVAMLMIYFRLLGRLAWCCGERGAATPTDAEPDGENEEWAV